NGEYQNALGFKSFIYFVQYLLIVLNMLDDIESTNPIKMGSKWNFPGIELHELNFRQALGCEFETFYIDVAAGKLILRKPPLKSSQDEASAATDLQETAAGRQVPLQSLENEPISGLKPKMTIFCPGQIMEKSAIKVMIALG